MIPQLLEMEKLGRCFYLDKSSHLTEGMAYIPRARAMDSSADDDED